MVRVVFSRPLLVELACLTPSSSLKGLAAGLGMGAASEALRRVSFGPGATEATSSLFMSEANVRRLVDKLSRMRGAALKLGQFMSIQGARLADAQSSNALLTAFSTTDTKLLPAQVEQIMMQVQNSANYMPQAQTEVFPSIFTTRLTASTS